MKNALSWIIIIFVLAIGVSLWPSLQTIISNYDVAHQERLQAEATLENLQRERTEKELEYTLAREPVNLEKLISDTEMSKTPDEEGLDLVHFVYQENPVPAPIVSEPDPRQAWRELLWPEFESSN